MEFQHQDHFHWSARITSPNGLKLNHWPILRMWMPRNFFEKILSLSLRSLIHSSWTTDCSLITRSSKRYCCDLGITNRYSTSAYPQGNRHDEAINKVIVNGLKKRLDDAKEKWVEELSHILWTYRTTPRRSTWETPFSMTYGAEAIIPLETGFPMLRISSFTLSNNNGLLEKSLDLIEERRENAMVQLAYYQYKIKQGYDANVKLRPLTVGDLVLKNVFGTVKNPA